MWPRTCCRAVPSVRTKNYEASVRISGAQRILGRAAIHGAVELRRHSLQNQLLPLSLGAAIQQSAPYSRPGEEGLGEHLILSKKKKKKPKRPQGEGENKKKGRERRREEDRGIKRGRRGG